MLGSSHIGGTGVGGLHPMKCAGVGPIQEAVALVPWTVGPGSALVEQPPGLVVGRHPHLAVGIFGHGPHLPARILAARYAARMIEIDHVIALVADLDEAAAALRHEHGLGSVPGGRHPGHGTGNRIIPLGTTYLELMAVVDPVEAVGSPMGRWAAAHTRSGAIRPVALCLRTDDIDAVASTLGEEPLAMSRETPDGSTLSWRLAGADAMFGPDRLPFFIQWDPGDHPGAAAADHAQEVGDFATVVIGDPGERAALLAGVDGIEIAAGVGVVSVEIPTGSGSISLG